MDKKIGGEPRGTQPAPAALYGPARRLLIGMRPDVGLRKGVFDGMASAESALKSKWI
jgi:hypothetical protein